MTGVAPDLGRLGRALAREQDAELGRVELSTRQRLLEAPPGELISTRGRAPWLRQAAASRWLWLSAAAAVLLFIGWALVRPAAVTFVVGDTEIEGATDDWLAATATDSLSVRFSDGTTLTLSPKARARVVATSGQGATVVVERGQVEADVVHRRGSRWSLRVGPYELRVHGTRFSAGWDAQAEQLSVELVEGAIEVVGPGIEQGRVMAAGTRLVAHAPERQVTLSRLSDARRAAAAPDESTDADRSASRPGDEPFEPFDDPSDPSSGGGGGGGGDGSAESLAGHEPSGARRGADGGATRSPSWRAMFEAGRHRDALGRARAEGFERLCAQSDAADLMALADAARFGGSPALATQALMALRNRFPSDGRASVAAFLLGSIAFDHAGSHGEATRWFQTYLAEQPNGSLAREAMGRLLEAAVRGGNEETTRSVARRYLEAYPSGPHAGQARRALASE